MNHLAKPLLLLLNFAPLVCPLLMQFADCFFLSNDFFHPEDQFWDGEGLSEIIIRSDFKAKHSVLRHGPRRKHQYAHPLYFVPLALADQAAEFPAIEIRHHQIKNKEV